MGRSVELQTAFQELELAHIRLLIATEDLRNISPRRGAPDEEEFYLEKWGQAAMEVLIMKARVETLAAREMAERYG